MKLSVSTALHSTCPDRERWRLEESVRFLGNPGFEALDIDFTEAIHEYSFFQQEDWRKTVERIGLAAEEYNIETSQSHLPFYNFATPGHENLEMKAKMFGRALKASAMLGVKWAVFHAGNSPDAVLSVKESKRRTLEYIQPFMEQAGKLGVGIAIENLFIPEYLHSTHRYCSNVEDVCDLVDTLGPGSGVCWDFGHANLIGDDQRECLRTIGKRLKVLHVHDNNGKHDDHAIPYSSSGTVKWEEILPVLREIGYEGNFSFEVSAARVPEALREDLAAYLIKLGRQMITTVNNEKKVTVHYDKKLCAPRV